MVISLCVIELFDTFVTAVGGTRSVDTVKGTEFVEPPLFTAITTIE